MSTLEKTVELIEIALLDGQADLNGFAKVAFDTDTHQNMDRVVVRCSPRKELLTKGNNITVVAWSFLLEVAVHYSTVDAAAMDTKIAAVEAANVQSGSTAAAVTLATAAFPGGFRIEETQDGERDHSADVRTRRRMFNF